MSHNAAGQQYYSVYVYECAVEYVIFVLCLSLKVSRKPLKIENGNCI